MGLQEHKDLIQRLKDQQIKKEKRELEIKTKQQEQKKMKEDIKETEVQISKLEDDIENAKKDVEPVKFKLRDKEKEKYKAVKEKDTWLEEENKRVHVIKNRQRKLNEFTQSISSYLKSGGEKKLTECKNSIIEIKRNIGDLGDEKKKLESKEKLLDKEINNVRQHESNME